VAEDGAMGFVVEVLWPDDERDFVARFREKEQAADYGSLGFDAARRLAIEQLADTHSVCAARRFFYRGH